MDSDELSRELILGNHGTVKVLTEEGDELNVTLVERETDEQSGNTTIWLRTELA